MDEHTTDETHRTPRAPEARGAAARAGEARAVEAPAAEDGQQQLPFDPLPFDDEADHPVPYQLTARARREVAPASVPDLAVVRPSGPASRDASSAPATGARGTTVGEDGALEEPGDTRPSRARALRRAGLSVAAIAGHVGADELAVRAWLGDLAGRSHRRGRGANAEAVAEASAGALAEAGAPVSAAGPPDSYRRARERAVESAPTRLGADPAFAAGLGLLAGIADVDAHSVGVTTRDLRVAAAAVRWLVEHASAPPERVRVVLRLGPRVAADVARHRWSQALDVPCEQITHTRWRGSPDGDEEAIVRVADPTVAGAVSGWTQALLTPPSPEPVGAAF